MPGKEKDYFTTREAAELLNVAVSTIQLWTDNGLLHAWTTAGGHRRIAKIAVEKMLSQQTESIKQNSEQPLSIVVVEDNEQEMTLYKENFECWHMNADIHMSKDGYAGLINIGKTSPKIIITDLMMPNLNGFEMIKAIKENPDFKHSLIIAVSALTEDEIRIRGGLPSDVLVFSKPVEFDKLKKLLREKIALNIA